MLVGFKTAADTEKRAEQNAIAVAILTECAQEAGLEDVNIVTEDSKERSASFDFVVQCSNFGELTYQEMLSAQNTLENRCVDMEDERLKGSFCWPESFVSGKDVYGVDVQNKTIYRNGVMLCDDSPYYRRDKSITAEDFTVESSASSDSTVKRPPYTGKKQDKYGAGEYRDMERFYEDHWDDFESFDDAETYWEAFN